MGKATLRVKKREAAKKNPMRKRKLDRADNHNGPEKGRIQTLPDCYIERNKPRKGAGDWRAASKCREGQKYL